MKHLNLSNPELRGSKREGFTSVSLLIALVLMLAAGGQAFGQSASPKGHVRGVVKDEKGESMAGASVYLKGTTQGTTTDNDGRFEFPRELNQGDRLTFSFIGYESVEYVVNGTAGEDIEIVMNVDVTIIGDVAVDEVYTARPGLRQFFRRIF